LRTPITVITGALAFYFGTSAFLSAEVGAAKHGAHVIRTGPLPGVLILACGFIQHDAGDDHQTDQSDDGHGGFLQVIG
jgi:hypothetical protein